MGANRHMPMCGCLPLHLHLYFPIFTIIPCEAIDASTLLLCHTVEQAMSFFIKTMASPFPMAASLGYEPKFTVEEKPSPVEHHKSWCYVNDNIAMLPLGDDATYCTRTSWQPRSCHGPFPLAICGGVATLVARTRLGYSTVLNIECGSSEEEMSFTFIFRGSKYYQGAKSANYHSFGEFTPPNKVFLFISCVP